jgi:hypothetical protein
VFCSKPGGVILASVAFQATIPFYSHRLGLARATFRFSANEKYTQHISAKEGISAATLRIMAG